MVVLEKSSDEKPCATTGFQGLCLRKSGYLRHRGPTQNAEPDLAKLGTFGCAKSTSKSTRWIFISFHTEEFVNIYEENWTFQLLYESSMPEGENPRDRSHGGL
jgi:hypothetical protein